MEGAWRVEGSPVPPLEKQMQLLLLSCRGNPQIMLGIPQRKRMSVTHLLYLQGNAIINSDLMQIDANEKTPADFRVDPQVRRNDIIWILLRITTEGMILWYHQSWQYCQTFWTKVSRSVSRCRRALRLCPPHLSLVSQAVCSVLWPGAVSVGQTSTWWRYRGDTLGMQIPTALSLALYPPRTQFHTCSSSAVLCKGREEASSPSPKPLQEQKRMCYFVKEVRAETVRERWGQDTIKARSTAKD